MEPEHDTFHIGRDRISRVFRYLEALNQHRNPAKRQIREQLWILWFHDLPDHPSVRKGIVNQPSKDSTNETPEPSPDAESVEDDCVLKVRRPALTQAPPPPEVITSWLEHGWNDPQGAVRVRTSQNEVDDRGETRIVRFSDDPMRSRELALWKVTRDVWAQNEVPARRAMRIFEQLYEVYGRIDREVERVELVVGDGILSWRRTDGGVYHPVLLQRLQLEFDPMVPEFTLVESEHEVELYSVLFRSMTDVDGKSIAAGTNLLRVGIIPWGMRVPPDF